MEGFEMKTGRVMIPIWNCSNCTYQYRCKRDAFKCDIIKCRNLLVKGLDDMECSIYICNKCQEANEESNVSPCVLFIPDDNTTTPDSCPYEKLHSSKISIAGEKEPNWKDFKLISSGLEKIK